MRAFWRWTARAGVALWALWSAGAVLYAGGGADVSALRWLILAASFVAVVGVGWRWGSRSLGLATVAACSGITLGFFAVPASHDRVWAEDQHGSPDHRAGCRCRWNRRLFSGHSIVTAVTSW